MNIRAGGLVCAHGQLCFLKHFVKDSFSSSSCFSISAQHKRRWKFDKRGQVDRESVDFSPPSMLVISSHSEVSMELCSELTLTIVAVSVNVPDTNNGCPLSSPYTVDTYCLCGFGLIF